MSNATYSARTPFRQTEARPGLLAQMYRATPLHIFIAALKDALRTSGRR